MDEAPDFIAEITIETSPSQPSEGPAIASRSTIIDEAAPLEVNDPNPNINTTEASLHHSQVLGSAGITSRDHYDEATMETNELDAILNDLTNFEPDPEPIEIDEETATRLLQSPWHEQPFEENLTSLEIPMEQEEQLVQIEEKLTEPTILCSETISDDESDAFPQHPWKHLYEKEPPKKEKSPLDNKAPTLKENLDAILGQISLDQIQAFRTKSLKWITEARKTSPGEQNNRETRTQMSAKLTPPTGIFAPYVLTADLGTEQVLLPLFNETVADDRLDLRLVRFNSHAIDQAEPERKINIRNYFPGDIMYITKLQARAAVEVFESREWGYQDVEASNGKSIFEVAEFFLVPRDIAENVITSPFSDTKSGGGKFLCVGYGIDSVIELKKKRTPRNTSNDSLLETTVMTPMKQPGNFLCQLKQGAARRAAILRCPPFRASVTILSSAITIKPAHESIVTMFQDYEKAYQYWDDEHAFEVLNTVVEHGANGLHAIQNLLIDRHMYQTTIESWHVTPPWTYMSFNLAGVSGPPPMHKWNRSARVRIEFDNSFSLNAEITNITGDRDKIVVYVKTLETSAKPILRKLINHEYEILVQQQKEAKRFTRYDPNQDKAPPHGSNADQILQCFYGNHHITSPDLPNISDITLASTKGDIKLLDTQIAYAQLVAERNIPCLAATSSFGCGKTLAIAAAAILSLEKVRPGKTSNIVSAVTNAAVVSLVEKIEQLAPSGDRKIVRIISEDNAKNIEPAHRTNYDLPDLVIKTYTNYLNLAVETCKPDEITLPQNEVREVISFLKTRSIIEEDKSWPAPIKNIFRENIKRNKLSSTLSLFFKLETFDIVTGTIESILTVFSRKDYEIKREVESIQLDEASTIPRHTLLRTLRCFPHARIALVGDPKQLRPFFDKMATPILIETAVSNTLEEAIERRLFPEIFFSGVFRCRPEITRLLSHLFYEGKLESIHQPARTERMLRRSQILGPKSHPNIFISLKSQHTQSGSSLTNTAEAKLIMSFADHLLQSVGAKDIAILVFYKAQIGLLSSWSQQKGVFVGSVDSAQGREWNICIIATTRSERVENSEFLADKRRLNVALSRSRHANIIIGRGSNLAKHYDWQAIVSDARNNHSFYEAQEFAKLWRGDQGAERRPQRRL